MASSRKAALNQVARFAFMDGWILLAIGSGDRTIRVWEAATIDSASSEGSMQIVRSSLSTTIPTTLTYEPATGN